jgi:RNA polymerase sigma-70 factor (ECF subfamily)
VSSERTPTGSAAAFHTTRWSVVLTAGHRDGPAARAALETLCAAYWYPLYAYVRRRGIASEDARDLTQSFFAQLLERNDCARADRDRGRFRAFLLASLRHHLANEWDRERAAKRGGGATPAPLDLDGAEERYALEDDRELTPEQHFDRTWALEVLEKALALLQSEYAARGQAELFAALSATLTAGEASESYAAIAARLGSSEGAIKVAAHRLRERYRETLRAEVAGTLADPSLVDEELAALRRTFST